jgi:hypothetical protein
MRPSAAINSSQSQRAMLSSQSTHFGSLSPPAAGRSNPPNPLDSKMPASEWEIPRGYGDSADPASEARLRKLQV